MRKDLDDIRLREIRGNASDHAERRGRGQDIEDLGARRIVEKRQRLRPDNEYTEHARAIGLNLHIREDAHLR